MKDWEGLLKTELLHYTSYFYKDIFVAYICKPIHPFPHFINCQTEMTVTRACVWESLAKPHQSLLRSKHLSLESDSAVLLHIHFYLGHICRLGSATVQQIKTLGSRDYVGTVDFEIRWGKDRKVRLPVFNSAVQQIQTLTSDAHTGMLRYSPLHPD